jgi:hypothetical protein
MKRCYFMIIVIAFLLFLNTCKKEESAVFPIQIKTDKAKYSASEAIQVEVTNGSDSLAMYYKCSSVKGIPFIIYKLEDKSWSAYWAPVCDGYRSFCCPEFLAGELYKDTLDMVFKSGTYKLEYQFIVWPGHEYVPFYSNSFNVK